MILNDIWVAPMVLLGVGIVLLFLLMTVKEADKIDKKVKDKRGE